MTVAANRIRKLGFTNLNVSDRSPILGYAFALMALAATPIWLGTTAADQSRLGPANDRRLADLYWKLRKLVSRFSDGSREFDYGTKRQS